MNVINRLDWLGGNIRRLFQAPRRRRRTKPLRERTYLIGMMAVQPLIAGAIGWIINLFFTIGSAGFLIGAMIWTLILLFTPAVHMFFVNVTPNHAVVFANQLRRYESPEHDEHGLKLKETRVLREAGPGLQGKLPWETIANNRFIDLRRHIVLSSNVSAYSKDGIQLIIDWQVILTPLRGYLTNLVRFDLEAIRKFFLAECQAFIICMINKHDEKWIFENIGNLEEEFEYLFGGPVHTDDTEELYGVFTNDPQLVSVTRSEAYQKAAEAKEIAAKNAEAVRKFKDLGIDPEHALNVVLAQQGGNVDIKAIRISGLEELKNVNLAGLTGLFGAGGETKKGGKQQKGS